MKKLFALVLSLCFMTTLFCTTAFAEETVIRVSAEKTDGSIVAIEDFEDFDKGWDSAVELALDSTLMKKNGYSRVVVDIFADWNKNDSSVYFSDGVNITLNLNGHTIDRCLDEWDYAGEVVCIGKNADVIINDGTVKGGFSCNSAGGIHIKGGAKVVLNNINVVGNTVKEEKGAAIAVYNKASLTMNGGSLSDNKIIASLNVFEWSEGALYVSGATAVLNDVAISKNQAYDAMNRGAAVSLNGKGNVTLNGCVVEGNGTAEDSLANSVFYMDDASCVLNLNSTAVTNNGYLYDAEEGFNPSMFDLKGTINISGCTFAGNIQKSLFKFGYTDSVAVNAADSAFTDGTARIISFTGDADSSGFGFMGSGSEYTLNGFPEANIVFTNCELGDTAFENKENIGFEDSSSLLENFTLDEDYFSDFVSVFAIVVSIGATAVALIRSNKKSVSKKEK